ncbi:MAG: hypothetical protein ACT4PV_05850 [Planctomycetaceae bacterium]
MNPKAALILLLPIAFAQGEEKPPPPADAALLAQVDKARAAIVAGKQQDAVPYLQEAIRFIQEAALKGITAFLPKRDKPWVMGEIESNTGTWGSGKEAYQWSQTSRTYERDEQRVVVTISTSPQLIEAQRAGLEMFRNPQMRAMLQQDEERTVEFIDADGWFGMLTTEREGGSSMIVLHKKVMVNLELATGSATLAREFWESIDRRGLAAAVP